MKISVLYINHVGVFGGSGRSLLELLKILSIGSFQPYVVSQKGQFINFLENEKIPVIATTGISQFDNTDFSYYRGVRWLVVLRELAFLMPTFTVLIAAKNKWANIDIIHVNELTAMPAAILAKFFFKVPLVVHVRSVQRSMSYGLRGKLLKHLIRRYVDKLIAIDCTVKESLPKDLPVEIVRNGFPMPSDAKCRVGDVNHLNFSKEYPMRVGCVGSLIKMKGVYDLVEAARLCAKDGLFVEIIFVGENMRNLRGIKGYFLRRLGFAADVRSELQGLVSKYNLQDRVKINRFTADIKSFYDSIHVLCFPSHLNACGRPIFEAAFSHLPSIVAINNPLEDTVIDGQTGICIPAMDPCAILRAISFLYHNPKELRHMGNEAYQLAVKNFDIHVNAKKMSDIYLSLMK